MPKKQNQKKPAPVAVSQVRRRTFLSRIIGAWKQKFPVLIFVAAFAVLMAAFYTFWLSDFFTASIQPRIVSVNAFLSNAILNLLGCNTTQQHEFISSPQFSISISRGCDGIEGMAIFAAGMLAFPMRWSNKLKFILLGIALLFVLNLVRIISLFLTGVYYPGAFEVMHVEIWQALFIIVALGLWIFFIQKSLKLKSTGQPASQPL